MSYNLCFTKQENKTRKLYLVIIMSKDLLTHVLVSLPFETMLMLKNVGKKKLFEKIRKNKIMHKSPALYTQVSCSFKENTKHII